MPIHNCPDCGYPCFSCTFKQQQDKWKEERDLILIDMFKDMEWFKELGEEKKRKT